MCGGTSTTTQSTTIPPEVLARYNAVNARAENVANTPFQRYTGEFVAPLNSQQMAGFANINQASGLSQNAFNTSQQMLGQANQQGQNALGNALDFSNQVYNAANPYLAQGQNLSSQGYNQASGITNSALNQISGLTNAASPYVMGGLNTVNAAAGQSGSMLGGLTGDAAKLAQSGQNYLNQGMATQGNAYGTANQNYGNLYSSTGQMVQNAQPYMQSGLNKEGTAFTNADYNIGNLYNSSGQLLSQASPYMQSGASREGTSFANAANNYGNIYNTAGQLLSTATPFMQSGTGREAGAYDTAAGNFASLYGNTGQMASSASPYMQSGLGTALSAYQGTQPAMQSAGAQASAGFTKGTALTDRAEGLMNYGFDKGQRLSQQALEPISGALSASQPYMSAAGEATYAGLGAARPMMDTAERYLSSGTQDVNAQDFNQRQVDKYMSPYLKNVVKAQQELQLQENAAQRSALNSQAIGAGAFGGDRAGITQANLARQQSLANQATLGNLLNQGYNQATGMFQQQQGVNLAAQQANRAAQQFGSQQAANLAQQRFGQQMTTGQNLAALGGQNFNQQLAQGRAISDLGQQMYAQGIGAASQAAGLGQNTYNMGMGLSQNTQNMAQSQFGMGAQMGNMQQATGQNMFNMQAQQNALQQALANSQYQSGLQSAQFQQATGQNMFNMGNQQAQLQRALAADQYNTGLQSAQFQQQTGQNLFNMGAQQNALQQSLANNQYNNALQSANFQQNTGQNLFNMNAQQAGLQQGITNNQYNAGLQAAQFQSQTGQNAYNMNAGQLAAQQGLAQNIYNQGLQTGQFQQGTGQNLFNMNAQQANMAQAAGQNLFNMGQQAGQFAQNTGNQQYAMGQQQAGMQANTAQNMYNMTGQTALNQANLANQQQNALLQGAQAQVGAGTLAQQTQQAQNTAQYQQFLQERGYPFQVAQFLANIAMGTGALSGSTTTTTQPNSFFSDRRLKKDIKEIGETHDGLPIYSFKYKGGDEQPRIGFMADEVREKHPDAVSRHDGIDSVNYEKVANRESEGGGVIPSRAGQGYAAGGHISDQDLSQIIAAQKEFLGPHGQSGPYGQSSQNMPGVGGIVPQKSVYVSKLQGHSAPQRQPSGMQQGIGAVGQVSDLGERLIGDKGLFGKQGIGSKAIDMAKGVVGTQQTPTASTTPNRSSSSISTPQPIGYDPNSGTSTVQPTDIESKTDKDFAYGGLVRPALKFGGSDIYKSDTPVIDEEILDQDAPSKIGEAPTSSGRSSSNPSGLSQLASAAGAVGSVASAGSAVAKLIPLILAPFGLKNGGVVPSNDDLIAAYRDREGHLNLEYDRRHRAYGGGLRPAYEGGGEAKKEYTLDDYLNSLATIESSHNYEAKGPVTKNGDRAYGKYQVMGSNVPVWTEEHYGQRLSPQEFIANRDAQEAVARGEFGKYLNKYGTPEDAASAWFSGRPMARAGNSADITGTTVPEYINRFRANLGLNPIGDAVPNDGRTRSVAGAESVVGEGGKRTDYVDGSPVSKGGIEPPVDYRTGKPYESWGDFATSRQMWIPLLSGIGATAGSSNRYALGAIAEGLGAAANSYAGLERPMVEGDRGRALAAKTGEESKKVAAETDVLKTALYEKKWIPGVGWWVYDKTKPYDPGKQITDSNMQPVGGSKVDPNSIPTAKDSAQPGGAPSTSAPQTTTTPSTQTSASAQTKPSDAMSALTWKPTTTVPEGYYPKEHFNIVNSPEIASREATIAASQLRDQRSKSEAAYTQTYRLDEMQHAFDNLPVTGLLSPGSYGTERADFAKKINTAASILGGRAIFNPSDIGAAETLGKDTFRLGQAAAASAGSREAQAIVQASVGATPGIDNTPLAYRRIAAGMRQAAQYEMDRTAFLDNYNSKYGHISGADEMFRKLNPPAEYARQAVISTIDPKMMDRITKFVSENRDFPPKELANKLARVVDDVYGKGTAATILGVH